MVVVTMPSLENSYQLVNGAYDGAVFCSGAPQQNELPPQSITINDGQLLCVYEYDWRHEVEENVIGAYILTSQRSVSSA